MITFWFYHHYFLLGIFILPFILTNQALPVFIQQVRTQALVTISSYTNKKMFKSSNIKYIWCIPLWKDEIFPGLKEGWSNSTHTHTSFKHIHPLILAYSYSLIIKYMLHINFLSKMCACAYTKLCTYLLLLNKVRIFIHTYSSPILGLVICSFNIMYSLIFSQYELLFLSCHAQINWFLMSLHPTTPSPTQTQSP